ncbi:uncharacterized protein BDW47DRAFT_121172 [Aspergillus candidus]|uniref:Uncharacterized protein n=1 Tax=Aspergillus candidus TaxID=41067 RepID=A0A2I2EYQ1_ASPCN|nr:hypothetical protein BDW47DRAFT_121172 [Aspergillus candidus]PLB33505.1 hypothetical protein BDW47DRAFT_121172 [Aspergillus candidus]
MQFVGRGAQLIAPNQGCAVHIIMERSTAKTMDCYVEVQTRENAHETVTRINSIYETGRAPRMGSRHVAVEVSSQDALLRDLFPRAKCIIWNDGIPTELRNMDRFSTGFCGFFTSEEIVGAIRHAEIPHRSPFGAKCPQRTYESTISTLYKFPWYATRLYSVHERNELFTLTNRHMVSLVSRIKRINTMGLDERLIRDLLFAGLNCPAFNDRQKYTLCINAQDIGDSVKFPDISRWFPFDTLAKKPTKDENCLMYYAKLISQGTTDGLEIMGLVNTFPMHNYHLDSPYGRVWFEWPEAVAKETTWEDASRHEMDLLCNLIVSGLLNDRDKTPVPRFQNLAIGPPSARSNTQGRGVSAHMQFFPASNPESSAMASRRGADMLAVGSSHVRHATDTTWNHKLLLPATSITGGPPGHRITRSTPACILSSETPLNDEY